MSFLCVLVYLIEDQGSFMFCEVIHRFKPDVSVVSGSLRRAARWRAEVMCVGEEDYREAGGTLLRGDTLLRVNVSVEGLFQGC